MSAIDPEFWGLCQVFRLSVPALQNLQELLDGQSRYFVRGDKEILILVELGDSAVALTFSSPNGIAYSRPTPLGFSG
jgi:hypothetical protein